MKKPPVVAVILAVSLLTPRPAGAYPIPPVTLWHLIEQADIVVLARVVRIDEPEEQPTENEREQAVGDGDVAVLRVLETWKGEEPGEIRVNFSRGVICPAPPRYEVGEIVLAFLERGETHTRRWAEANAQREEERLRMTPEEKAAEEAAWRETGREPPTVEEEAQWKAEGDDLFRRFSAWAMGRWLTIAESYGTLYPAEEDQPVFRDLVRQAVRLQAAGKVEPADRREWLISAAERRATRWQGLYELTPAADQLHYFYDGKREATPLTGSELDRLARGFVREPSVDSTLTMLIPLLAPLPDAAVDRAAVAAIEAALENRRQAWWLPGAIEAAIARFGDPEPKRRLGRHTDCDGRPICESVNSAALPGIWETARRELGIPEVAPAEVPERRVFGVGGETPD